MGVGIREARKELPTLVRRVSDRREEFRIGPRGAEEATLIATGELERLRERLAELEHRLAGEVEGNRPFAGLMRRVADFAPAPTDERQRRRISDPRQENNLSREDMVRLGARGASVPRLRRTKPRA